MDLNDTERSAVRAALARMQLLRPGDGAAITPLAGGVSSLIVRVDTGDGRTLCVKMALPRLKVAALWEAPVERNRAEVAWMRTARRIVPQAVPPILGDDAEGNAFAMAFLEPADHPVWKAQLLAGHADVGTAVAVARSLVAIHAATAADAHCAAAFANDASFHALRLEPYFIATAARHPECAAALHRLVDTTARTKLALVHGDVSPKNILVGPQGPVLLDAECAWWGDPAFDLAFCLNHLLLKSVARPAIADDCVRCFEALAATYLAGVDWESPAAFEARCAALLGGLLLARIDGKSPLEYLTAESERAHVRGRAIPLLTTPVDRLSLVIQRWNQPEP